MAENTKKFYWIKLKTDFFNLDTIDFLLSQKNGCEYVVLYQMLCLISANTGGKLYTQIGEMIVPYDINKIVRETKYFKYDTVVIALDLYKKLGLVYVDYDGCLQIVGYDALIGSETKWAEKKRLQREKNKNLIGHEEGQQENDDGQSKGQCPQQDEEIKGRSIGQEVDDVRQENKSIRDIEYIDNKYIYTMGKSDLENRPTTTSNPGEIELILKDGNNFVIQEKDIDEWKELYPDVNILQEFKHMKGWLISNPKKRKSKEGILRFINNWLASEQKKKNNASKGHVEQMPNYDAPKENLSDDERNELVDWLSKIGNGEMKNEQC